MNLRLYDAHNHLQDERLGPCREAVLAALPDAGIAGMVVNGCCEADWPEVAALARRCPGVVVPSFGYHPWYVTERSPDWQRCLAGYLDSLPAAVGEIGLDRWIRDPDFDAQVEVFTWQWRLAAERNLPVSVHCLQAWGRLFDILSAEPGPRCGFVLHSFGGPPEMVGPLAKLGARFSLPGCFALERKQRQRETFRQVPPDRLLIETDAPDQSLPPERVQFPLAPGPDGRPINHPANLGAVYTFAAELLGFALPELAAQVEANFLEVFGGLRRPGGMAV